MPTDYFFVRAVVSDPENGRRVEQLGPFDTEREATIAAAAAGWTWYTLESVGHPKPLDPRTNYPRSRK